VPSISARNFRELISGGSRGVAPSLTRGMLAAASLAYWAAVRLRNLAYDWAILRSRRAGVSVISVGNLTAGGTGKSPFVRWLAEWFREQGWRPVVLSRGYRSAPGRPNDEFLEMRRRAPELLHLQGPDRTRLAQRAVDEFGAQVIILDDGFQHRRLARDLEIVLIDATEPFGYGWLLPRGLLREPLSALARARAVVLTRADQVSESERLAIWRRVAHHAPSVVRCEAAFVPCDLVDERGETHPLESLRGQPVFGFAGIGQPDNFRRTLESLGCRVVGFRPFPDHHAYTSDDLEQLHSAGVQLGARFLVCTEKDAVKISRDRPDSLPTRAVRIDATLLSSSREFEELLRGTIVREANGSQPQNLERDPRRHQDLGGD
jgi:tetraacyldisaccharide 4'-kinase